VLPATDASEGPLHASLYDYCRQGKHSPINRRGFLLAIDAGHGLTSSAKIESMF
jgi:hypothetical protein